MPPGKLDASILVALGLTVGCGDKDTGETGPCLDYATETGETGDTGETGPCLDYPTDTGETGPCLDYPTDTGEAGGDGDGDGGDDGQGDDGGDRAAATARVLERGVLPADVAKMLKKRQRE